MTGHLDPARRSAAVPMRGFEQSLPMALMRAREAVMANFRPTLARHGLTEQQFRVLRALTDAPDGLAFGTLADQTLLLGPSLSRIVANLESRGGLRRTTVEHDARRSHVSITELGRSLVAAIAPDSESSYEAIEAAVGTERLTQLHDILEDLTTAAAVASTRDLVPD